MNLYDPNTPGPYTPPVPPAPRPPKPKMPLWGKLVIIFVGAPTILIGAIMAIAVGAGIGEVVSVDATPTPVQSTRPGVHKPAPTTTKPRPTPTETTQAPAPAETQPAMTKSQEQAIGAARSYLEVSAFSRRGLIDQLSSKYGSGFPVADATFAVDQISVDWNEQAAKAARSYLEVTHFSRAGMIQQLESRYGSGFTHAQAVYGAKAAGL